MSKTPDRFPGDREESYLTQTDTDKYEFYSIHLEEGTSNIPDRVSALDSFFYAFDPDTTERLYFKVTIPQAWLVEESIQFCIKWMPGNDSDSGGVYWAVYNRFADVDESFPAGGSSTLQGSDSRQGTDIYRHHEHTFTKSGLTGYTKRVSIVGRLERQGTGFGDSYPNDALLVDFGILVPVSSIGKTL